MRKSKCVQSNVPVVDKLSIPLGFRDLDLYKLCKNNMKCRLQRFMVLAHRA